MDFSFFLSLAQKQFWIWRRRLSLIVGFRSPDFAQRWILVNLNTWTRMAKHYPWLNFFCPILGHFCPLFVQIAQMDLILPRWGLILPRIPPPTPVLYSAVTNPFLGYVRTRTHPTPKHPFSWPDFESRQNELLSGQNGPHLGKMFEKWAKLF